jgi:hypothetical protein
MNRAELVDHLAIAEQHVQDGADHIVQQRARIDAGVHFHDEALRMLETLEDLQAVFVLDRDRLLAELHKLDAGAG